MAIATGLISYCSILLHLKACLFANSNSSNVRTMVLILVFLCAPFLSPLLCRWQYAVCALWLQCEAWVSAVLAEALLCFSLPILFFFAVSTAPHWKVFLLEHLHDGKTVLNILKEFLYRRILVKKFNAFGTPQIVICLYFYVDLWTLFIIVKTKK